MKNGTLIIKININYYNNYNYYSNINGKGNKQ